MMNAVLKSVSEHKRHKQLDDLRVLDTGPEKEFDDIVRLAALICQAPVSLISLIDDDRQWFKAKFGIALEQTERDQAFCGYTVSNSDSFIVPNALNDARFSHFKMVTGPEHIRFYAGVPITFEGVAIGALCVKDREPRNISDQQLSSLKSLAHQVSRLLELRQQNAKLIAINHEAEVQKIKLRESNDELYVLNQELLSSEEEVRANLEQISLLQMNLELREKQYRELVESANDLIYELDNTGRFTFVNNMMEERSGYSKRELLAKSYWELIHPDDRPQILTFYKEQFKTGRETSYVEFRMVTASGEAVWIGQNVRMFFDENSWVYRVVSISRDINTLKMTERKLEDSERLYRLLSTNSNDLISLFDINSEVTRRYVSPSVKSLLGYEPEELIGRSAFSYVHPDDLDHVKQATLERTMNGQPTTIVYRAVKKDGETIWLESKSSPIFDEHRKMTGFQTSSRDISRRKEFEVSLQEAKKKAEDATMAKSQFLSMMSHEIRTPMNAIIGLTTLMLQNEPRLDQLESLKLLRFSGENLLTIVNDILDFSKIEANKLQLESVDIDLYGLMLNTKRILEQRAIEKQIVLNFHYDSQIPKKLLGDPVRIAQVITNLTGNAIKFTEKGSVDLKVMYGGEVNGKHRMRFEVRDTGIGIAKDKVEKIFERFAQAETETTRKYGGTGLGLSITKSLLELMGANINLESKPGVGSTFWFEVELPESAKTENDDRNPVSIAHKHTGVRVLLVEDNPVNQIVARGFLKQWGISVEVANNGLEALEMVAKKSYHVVLMDLQMPVMDGYEASQKIREMDGSYFTELPIIALTASAMAGMKDKVMDVGMTDFVSKPFSPDELHSKILKYATMSNL